MKVLIVKIFQYRGFPISGATFTEDGYLLQKIAASNVGTLGFVLVLLIRLYSGWGYAGARLQSKVIEYEGTRSLPLSHHIRIVPSSY
jgi:Conserved in the green lineage and diatoms 27